MMTFRFWQEQDNPRNRTAWIMTALASLPLVIYVRDRMGCFYRVRDNSMSPTLQAGDIVFVKKCSMFPWLSSRSWNGKTSSVKRPSSIDDTDDHLVEEDGNEAFMNQHQHQHQEHQQQQQQEEIEKARLIRYERMHGIVHPPGWFFQSIIPVPGQIIAYQNPCNPHREYIVQRVIGVGGQWIQQRNNSHSNNSYRLELLPIYTVFVEGDNHQPQSPPPPGNSDSSGRILSRNLVAGVVESIVWPPSRWQKSISTNTNIDHNNPNTHPAWKDRARWS
jgi:signal peptidase I